MSGRTFGDDRGIFPANGLREELHASQVDKMLRKPGEVAAFEPIRQSA
jgi:hypothetical protein